MTSCINKIKNIRKNDIEKYKQCNSTRISYFIDICEDPHGGNILESDSDDDRYLKINSEFGELYNVDEQERKNIKKIINNCKLSDRKYWKKRKTLKIGSITYEYIIELLKMQNYKCHKCNDKILTHSYIPYCSYKFSIDRIDNSKPHDKNNMKISCFFVIVRIIHYMERTKK